MINFETKCYSTQCKNFYLPKYYCPKSIVGLRFIRIITVTDCQSNFLIIARAMGIMKKYDKVV